MRVQQLIALMIFFCTGCYTIAFHGPKPSYFKLNYQPSSGVEIKWATKSKISVDQFSLLRKVYRIGDPLSARPLEFVKGVGEFYAGEKVLKGEPFYHLDKDVQPGKRYCYTLVPYAPGMLQLSSSRYYCIDIKPQGGE